MMIIVSLRFLKMCVVMGWKSDHYLFCTTYKIKAIFNLQSSAIIFRVRVHVVNQCYTAIIDCALFKANPSVALLKVSVFHLSIIVHCFQYRILSLLDNFIEQIFLALLGVSIFALVLAPIAIVNLEMIIMKDKGENHIIKVQATFFLPM
jgi:hypothetical protein